MRQKPVLTASDVQKMAAACRAEAAKKSWGITFAIVDDAGVLLHLERLDGASQFTVEMARLKALTAAVTQRPSKSWEDRTVASPVFLKFPQILPRQGGVPIMHEGECVGAIGVSGRPEAAEDEQLATVGIAALR
jgi:glc operon protein GlcG